jgi:hypothetical protein
MEPTQIVKIRLVRNYSTYTVGRVIECEAETAKRLLAEGTAEQIETASVEPLVERADRTPRRVQRAVQKPRGPDASDHGAGDAQ